MGILETHGYCNTEGVVVVVVVVEVLLVVGGKVELAAGMSGF